MATPPKPRLLVVDDEPSVRRLLAACLEPAGYEVETASSGEEALQVLSDRPIQLVLTDVSMPGMSGLELLEVIAQKHSDCGAILLSGSQEVPLAVRGMQLGALDYVLKPFRVEALRKSVQQALERHAKALAASRERDELRAEVMRLSRLMHEISEASLEGLIATLDVREGDTGFHSRRVSNYAVRLARQARLDEDECRTIRRGALVHDIGKVAVPDRILLKAGPLNDDEWTEIRKHPQTGFAILSALRDFRAPSELVLAHHERFDGTGYPFGLRGLEVPVGARIFAIVDTLDAMISDRSYRAALPFHVAAAEIERCRDTQFDPDLVDHFMAIPESDWASLRLQTVAC